jgi:hypothetical protein
MKHHAMKTNGKVKYSFTVLDLGTRRRSVLSFTPRPLYLRERATDTHCRRGLVGFRAGLDVVE